MISASALVDKFEYALDNKWGYIWGAAGILWTEAKQKQKVDYMVSKYGTSWKKNSEAKSDNYYNAAVYGSKWIGHYVADCSGLFAWAFAKLGGSIAHGSNSIYDRYCTEKGKLTNETRKTIKPGTAVFTGDAKSHGHIGLYVGNGKVIEASGTQAGVCVSNLSASKWTYWGELRGVTYDTEGSPTEDVSLPTLRRGDKGTYVKKLQTLLKERAYNIGSCGIDGDFGKDTQAAVKLFQKDHGLEPDGVVGQKTWEALQASPERKLYMVTGLTLDEAKAVCNSYKNATYKEMV